MSNTEQHATPEEQVASGLRRCPRAVLMLENDGARRGRKTAGVSLAAPDPITGTVALVIDGRLEPDATARVELEVFDSPVGCPAAEGVVRAVIGLTGTMLVPEGPAQRRLAIEMAREQPAPGLLTVGNDTTVGVMTPTSVVLTDRTGVATVPVEQFFSIGPDPFAELEGLWVAHFNDPRCPVVDKLVARLGRRRFEYRPLVTALDRFGLTLSEFAPDGGRADIRLRFDEDCVNVADLGRQIRLLMGCPRTARPLRGRAEGSRRAGESQAGSARRPGPVRRLGPVRREK